MFNGDSSPELDRDVNQPHREEVTFQMEEEICNNHFYGIYETIRHNLQQQRFSHGTLS